MADINLYQDDEDGNPDDGYGLDDGLDDETFGADDNLSPLQKLEKYMESDNVYTRQMVAKGLLDTLRAVGDSEEQTTAVLTAMVKLSDDSDPIVRSELMEQIANIAMYCQENKDIFQNAIPVYILPMVVRYLDDANNQVRKTSQAALLVLLEQELVEREHVEDQVVSVILELAGPDSLDEYRTEAVANISAGVWILLHATIKVVVMCCNKEFHITASFDDSMLMSKLAPLLGRDMVERVFLNRFSEMCCDPLFHVRKVCAANFGDFCSVVSLESVEKHLLPKFYYLCEDGVWGVRKACAECFMTVSYSCSTDVRKTDLAGVFVNLLCDQSRWVRMAAFQQLGPFISTFADSKTTGISVEPDGTIVFRDLEKNIKSSNEVLPQDQNNSSGISLDSEEAIVTEIVDTAPEISKSDSASGNPNNSDEKISSISASTNTPDCDTEMVQITVDMEIDENPANDNISGAELEMVRGELPDVETGLIVNDVNVSLEERRAQHYIEIEEPPTTGSVVQTEHESSAGSGSAGSPSENSGQISNIEMDKTRVNIDSIENSNNPENVEISQSINTDTLTTIDSGNVQIHAESVEDFNSFNYWRTPIPQIDIDLHIVDTLDQSPSLSSDIHDVQTDEDLKHRAISETLREMQELSDALSESLPDLSVCDKDNSTVMEEGGMKGDSVLSNQLAAQITNLDLDTQSFDKTNFLSNQNETTLPVIDGVVQDLGGSNMAYMDQDFSSMSPQSLRDSLLLDDATLAQQQDIVPQSLLENYLGMIDPSRAQTVDTEITKYCAYNLPAVAYTLGRKNWHCIKNLYETLAADMQWKVRRTLAFSIHELAVILGEEITHRDLVPVFDGFLKDLDEVRIGILRHLADFLRLLHPDMRRRYLEKVREFMNLDNNRNWRFRLELAEQLILISELFSAREVGENLLPIALALADDKVCEVRTEAYHLISVMLRRLVDSHDETLVQLLVNQLTGKFAQNPKWASRQIYTQMCKAIIEEEAIEPLQFAKDFLPALLSLVNDPVPNVRITLAKTLTMYIMNEKYSNLAGHPQKDELDNVYRKLQEDNDRDVRYFSSIDSYEDMTNIQMCDSVSDSWIT